MKSLIRIDRCLYCEEKAEYVFATTGFWSRKFTFVCTKHRPLVATEVY